METLERGVGWLWRVQSILSIPKENDEGTVDLKLKILHYSQYFYKM